MRTPAVLTVLGEDRVGIVAAVSGTLAAANTNIEDIRQTILDHIFSMTMLVTVDEDHLFPSTSCRSALRRSVRISGCR